MTRGIRSDEDKQWSFEYPQPEEEIPLGEIGVYQSHPGQRADLTILTYGNGTNCIF
jgi:hypothetical protein